MLFWIPAIAGGIFGLLGGYLTDRLGRRRVLTYSILIYSFSAFAAGYSTNIWQFLFFRCTTFIGVCVEFVAAVAWLAEVFTEPKQRERVLGYTQAFSSIGGALVTAVNAWVLTHGTTLPAIYGGHEAWRYTLISGVIPALPLIIIRPFLPESPIWQQKKAAGTLKRPSLAEIFSPGLRRATIVTTPMSAMSDGAALGAIKQMPPIVPGTPEVAPLTISRPMPPDPPGPRPGGRKSRAPSNASPPTCSGGRKSAAGRADHPGDAAARHREPARAAPIFQVPGLIVVRWSSMAPDSSVGTLKLGMFFAGLFTVAQLSFWGNHLPRIYPTHLRGTGEGFAANVGGRMLGTGFAFVTTTLASNLAGAPHVQLAKAAAIVGAFVYVCGFALSFFLPEPKSAGRPD